MESLSLFVQFLIEAFFHSGSRPLGSIMIFGLTVRGGKVSQWPKGVSFVCGAAASLRNRPVVTRCPNFNVAAASSHFLDAKRQHIGVYARIYAYMLAYTEYSRIYAYLLAYTSICSHIRVYAGALRRENATTLQPRRNWNTCDTLAVSYRRCSVAYK